MFAVGNNLNRGHIYFQDFWKRFSILFKAKQLQLNRKQKQKSKKKREKKAHLGLTCAGPATWLGPACWRCQSSSSSRQKDAERVAGARGHTPATSCFRRRPGDALKCHATPTSPSRTRSLSPSSPSLSPATAERVPRRRSP